MLWRGEAAMIWRRLVRLWTAGIPIMLAMLAGYLATLADFLPHRKDPS